MKKHLVNLGLLSITFLLLALFLELGVSLYAYIKYPDRPPPKTRLLAESNYFTEQLAIGKRSYSSTLFPHPYLAYVHDPELKNINSAGLFGHEFPTEKKEGTFVILVTGGSVAAQVAGLALSNNILEEELNTYYTNDHIKNFIVLNGAAGAWRQPQQFILYGLNAEFIDGVITLDGFNEHYQLKGENHLRLEYPASNYATAIQNVFSRNNGFFLRMAQRIHRAHLDWPILRNSNAAYYFLTPIKKLFLTSSIAVMEPTLSRMFSLPPERPIQSRQDFTMRSYVNYIRMMHTIAELNGSRSLFLIQPVPAIGKVLTEEEKKVAGEMDYRDLYLEMTEQLLELQKQGVPIYSLLDVFKGVSGSIYRDAIHVSAEGNELLKDAIVNLLEREWGFARRAV